MKIFREIRLVQISSKTKTYRTRCINSLCLGLALFSASPALAAQIVVTDCAGAPRAVKEVDAERDQTVKLTAIASRGAPDEITISLTDLRGAAKKQVVSSSGIVSFDNVSSGTWKICGLPENVSIESVEISATEDGRDLRVASLVGGGLAATGLVLGSSGSTSSADSGSISGLSGEVAESLPQAQASTLGADAPSAAAAKPAARKPSAARPLGADEDCLARTDAPELSPVL